LLAMPFLFIVVLSLSLGEGFGEKPDNRLRVSVVDLDEGYTDPGAAAREVAARFACLPTAVGGGIQPQALSAAALAGMQRAVRFPQESWAKVVQRDLLDTADIRLEVIPTRQEAQRLVDSGKRAAVLVFGTNFSKRVHQSSFLAQGINPFYRDG